MCSAEGETAFHSLKVDKGNCHLSQTPPLSLLQLCLGNKCGTQATAFNWKRCRWRDTGVFHGGLKRKAGRADLYLISWLLIDLSWMHKTSVALFASMADSSHLYCFSLPLNFSTKSHCSSFLSTCVPHKSVWMPTPASAPLEPTAEVSTSPPDLICLIILNC